VVVFVFVYGQLVDNIGPATATQTVDIDEFGKKHVWWGAVGYNRAKNDVCDVVHGGKDEKRLVHGYNSTLLGHRWAR